MQKPINEEKKQIQMDAKDPLFDKKLMGKDKKLKAQIKSAVYLKKKSEKHLKMQRYLENETGGYHFSPYISSFINIFPVFCNQKKMNKS